MRLPEEYDEEPKVNSVVRNTAFIAFLAVLSIFMVVLLVNYSKKPSGHKNVAESGVKESVVQSSDNELVLSDSTLSPDDLDFWDKFGGGLDKEESTTSHSVPKKEYMLDPSEDGMHTLVINKDGEEEWIVINQYLEKHNYDFTKLVSQSGLMKYYVDGKKTSYVGVDVSKYEAYIDFGKLKKAGIDFVMIRVGARGYSTGQIMLDDYFLDNIKRASDAKLEIGLYFYSQAISKEEAEQEADLVLQYAKDYNITYPIAFVMEDIANDSARTDILLKEDKTKIAKAFLGKIKKAGYIPLLYGDKEWLIKQIELSDLTDYDVWLSQPGDLPDYPYKFTMWQYSTSSIVEGISGDCNLNISFIDYSVK